MDNSKNRQNEHLGVNKYGKNIRKSPLHQPNFSNNAPLPQPQPQPQPQVYNISKNDFRNIVQQLTGSPSQEPLPRPPQNPPRPQSMRLQRIRPPPLTPIHRPPVIPPHASAPQVGPQPVPYNNSLNGPAQFGPPSPAPIQPVAPGNSVWPHIAESPVSAYMRFLQSSLLDPSPRLNQGQSQLLSPPQVPGQFPQPPSSGLLPNPSRSALPSSRMSAPVPSMYNIPSSQASGPAFLPSPTSQFLLPSPTGYMNFLSPHSHYPLLSPGFQYPPQLSPTFALSPMAQSGILGPGSQRPPSPGLGFPLSPSWFFPISSPRWRDQ